MEFSVDDDNLIEVGYNLGDDDVSVGLNPPLQGAVGKWSIWTKYIYIFAGSIPDSRTVSRV